MKQAIFLIGILMLMPMANAQTQQVNVGITPSSPLFFLDKMFESIQIALTQNDVQRINLKARFLGERIIETQFIAEKKPQFTNKAIMELQKSTNELAEEAKLKPNGIKIAVEQSLKNSKQVLEAIKLRFESDDNLNNDNAIAGLKIAIENQERKIDEIEDSKDKDEIDVKINGDIAEVRAIINNQEIRYKVVTADVNEVLNDISTRTGISIDTIKNADVEINEKEAEIKTENGKLKVSIVVRQ